MDDERLCFKENKVISLLALMQLAYISWRLQVSDLVLCATQHSVPQYSGVYFLLMQNALAQTVGIGRKQNLKDMVMWTLELRHRHHSQTLGSPSKCSQRHKEHGCAYEVKYT